MADNEENLNTVDYLDWDTDEAASKARESIREAQHRRATAYHDVFVKSEPGRKILEEWVQSYCTGAPPASGASEREVGMMDGKRELVHIILQQIQIGESNGRQ